MRKLLVTAGYVLACFSLHAQQEIGNPLSHESYLSNPKEYLSDFDENHTKGQVFLDRALFPSILESVNGYSSVATIEYADFYDLYNAIDSAAYDSSFLQSFDSLKSVGNQIHQLNGANPIALGNFLTRRFSPQAIADGKVTELEDGLQVNSSSGLLSWQYVSFGSILTNNVYGDEVKFIIPEFFHFYEFGSGSDLVGLEIDLGDGLGYRSVGYNEIFYGHYSGESGYVEAKIKIKNRSNSNGRIFTHYVAFSFYRQKKHPLEAFKVELPIEDELTPSWGPRTLTFGNETITVVETGFNYGSLGIEYVTLSPNNDVYEPFKYRKPVVVVDGFDYQNTRNVWVNYVTKEKPLPWELDFRGILGILNGDPSPYYSGNTNPNLVKCLLDRGYDVVIVNFLDGTGDISENAYRLGKLLELTVNNPAFRDEKTLETLLIGPSMGGVVTRLMLARDYESAGREHYVRGYISFDSPHEGANIPIALQQALKHLARHDEKRVLNTKAARQLLLDHYSTSLSAPTPAQDHFDLQAILDQFGYPERSTNYAISNGGNELQFDGFDSPIIRYNRSYRVGLGSAMGWAQPITESGGTYYEILKARRGDFTHTYTVYKPIPIDNAPGGFNLGLYAMNYRNDNTEKPGGRMARRIRSCFIPTCSAFGVEADISTIHKKGHQFTGITDFDSTKIATPFDELFSMQYNEEHMRVTQTTTNKLIDDWFGDQVDEVIRPVRRPNKYYWQKVDAEVGYMAKERIEFGGAGGVMEFTARAKVEAQCENSTRFLPGARINLGASVWVHQENVSDFTVLRNALSEGDTPSALIGDSPFKGKVVSYETGNAERTKITLNLYPNPSQDWVIIQALGDESNPNSVKIFDVLGNLVYQAEFTGLNGMIDVSNFSVGVYHVQVEQNGVFSNVQKLIKQ